MKIKKITLKNIRSYTDEEIEFPEGSILLSGDIGSGKTSVLLAIEFALFGLQPGQKGSSLLRNGAASGSVKIEIEVDENKVEIERTLKKGKSVSQDYCSISVDGEKREISVMELKSKILNILNYPGEFSKKQNLLYKFTVYTPQEEMKQIILQDSETRVNVLRHVFGIDRYKRILENSSTLLSKVREEKRLKEALSSGLEQEKLNLVQKENELETKHHNLLSIEKELFLKTENRKKIQEEKELLSKKTEEKSQISQEIEKTKIMISNKKESISGNEKLTEQLKIQLRELEEIQFSEDEIINLEEKLNLLKKEKDSLNEKLLNISTEINSSKLRIRENENTKDKITHIENCPTCLQEVKPLYKANIFNKLDTEISESNEKIKSSEEEKTKIAEEILKINSAISETEKSIQEKKILKIKLESLNEKKARIQEIEKNNLSLNNEILELEAKNKTSEERIMELKKFDSMFEEKQNEFEAALKEERLAEIKTAELKREIQVFSLQIDEIRERIKKTEQKRKEVQYLLILENWISGKFMPLISDIEKNVMIKLKHEFSKLFSEWFSMLVSESFNARLSDDFTPIIEQQDYEIDYSYLSGGERTAVALAYRLALNQVINSLMSKIKTRDLLILDEPTDGFSAQQLDKMRDVLTQLNAKQLIIVSHEQKIESFVDNIVRFRKQNGVSGKEN